MTAAFKPNEQTIGSRKRARSSVLAFALVFMLNLGCTSVAFADDWYVDVSFRSANVSTEACETINSSASKWFTKPDPFSLQGHPATGKLYATLVSGDESDSTFSIIEQHHLTPTEGASLVDFYKAEAGAHVPYLLQLVASAFPAQLGTSLTLLDWMVSSGASAGTANDVAVLIQSGGTLTRSFAVAKDEDQHPWLLIQTTFGTTVSNQDRQYVVCSAAYPLKE